ncbi:Serine/threonine-specific protein phosphatase/bis(5-nucleosyl)-tetraphosphatase [Forsythia ovata]|uniref:Serine/threonine-specific protein phosphatase/bis(5-nucleosyl)-tetraphosphatase n=1 Tax=Forsythia ovata TaxID=205694 RepID=A0ABD1SLX6_9LAMI
MDMNHGESVSALMSEEYAEEAEVSTFTDDDISSHLSLAASSLTIPAIGVHQSGYCIFTSRASGRVASHKQPASTYFLTSAQKSEDFQRNQIYTMSATKASAKKRVLESDNLKSESRQRVIVDDDFDVDISNDIKGIISARILVSRSRRRGTRTVKKRTKRQFLGFLDIDNDIVSAGDAGCNSVQSTCLSPEKAPPSPGEAICIGSMECKLLAALKVRYPQRITILRGNHESRQVFFKSNQENEYAITLNGKQILQENRFFATAKTRSQTVCGEATTEDQCYPLDKE